METNTPQYRERPEPKWKQSMHVALESHYGAIYRDERLRCHMEIITKRKNGFPDGDGEVTFFIDGDRREFRTEEEMIDGIMNGPAELWVHAGTTRKAFLTPDY